MLNLCLGVFPCFGARSAFAPVEIQWDPGVPCRSEWHCSLRFFKIHTSGLEFVQIAHLLRLWHLFKPSRASVGSTTLYKDMRSAETPLHPGGSSIEYCPGGEPAPGLGVLCLVVAVLLLVSIGDTLVLVRGLRPGPFETGDIEPVSDTHPSSCSGHSDTAMQPCAGALLATALRLSSRPSSRAQIVVCWSRRAARRPRGWAAKWRSDR